ncbi:MAG: D-alanyl-D-alanine carboxypeptidase family protein [Coprococcus sp.]
MAGGSKGRRRRRGCFLKFVMAGVLLVMVALTAVHLLKNVVGYSGEWNLILVNKNHKIPYNYSPELIELSNGEKVDARIYPDLQKMFDDARAAGLQLFVRDGYRTGDEQKAIMNDKIAAYETEGYSKKEAKALAKTYVAEPGTSEHELGLSVDINAESSGTSQDAVYEWLDENAYKYGFIKRYPADKTDITGIDNEPWHYRYVGYEAAKEMKEQNLCLEEYLKKGKSSED